MKIHKVEKGVPVPEVNSAVKYPWIRMQVGDSVFFEAEKKENLYNLKRTIGPAARYYGDVTGKKFKVLVDRELNGVRVWRLE